MGVYEVEKRPDIRERSDASLALFSAAYPAFNEEEALVVLGVIGEYLGRVFNETKNRPLYLANDVALAEIAADFLEEDREASHLVEARKAGVWPAA